MIKLWKYFLHWRKEIFSNRHQNILKFHKIYSNFSKNSLKNLSSHWVGPKFLKFSLKCCYRFFDIAFSFFFFKMYLKFLQNCTKFYKNFPKIYVKFYQTFLEIYIKFNKSSSNSQSLLKNFLRIPFSSKFIQNVYKVYPKFFENFTQSLSKIYTKVIQNSTKIFNFYSNFFQSFWCFLKCRQFLSKISPKLGRR